MNCRFCGTLVPAAPSECPKCGRPVSTADETRRADQAAVATVVYSSKNLAKMSPRILGAGFVVFIAIATICAVAWSRHSGAATGQPMGGARSATDPVPVDSQTNEKPSAAIGQMEGGASTSLGHNGRPDARDEPGDETQTLEPPISSGPDTEQLLAKAEAAYSRGDWIQPDHDNALTWARQARSAGSQRGGVIEDQIYGRMMASLSDSRKARDYVAALEQVDSMIRVFPGHTSLPSVKATIQREQTNGVAP